VRSRRLAAAGRLRKLRLIIADRRHVKRRNPRRLGINRPIRRGAASNVASLFFLVPPTTAVMAWGIFGEVLGPIEIAGIAVTTIGVMMVNRPQLFLLRLTRG